MKKDTPESPPEVPLTIFQAMAKIVNDLGPVAKDKRNTEQNYQFRGIDAAMDALNPLLAKYGVFPTIADIETVVFDAIVSKSGSKGFHLIRKYTFEFFATDGTSVKTKMEGEAIDYGDKAVTKCQSVAYREALYKTFCAPFTASLDIEDDSHDLKPENENQTPKRDPAPAAQRQTQPSKPANQTPPPPKVPERKATPYGIKKNKEIWENYWIIKMGVKQAEKNPDGTPRWTEANMWKYYEDTLEALFGIRKSEELTIKQSMKFELVLKEKLNAIIAEESVMRVRQESGESQSRNQVIHNPNTVGETQ